MKLADLRAVIAQSRHDDWHPVDRGGTTYLESLCSVESGDQHWVEIAFHRGRVVYKPDVSIGLAWGLPLRPSDADDDGYEADWITNAHFSGRSHGAWIDVLYNGQVVDRQAYVWVDGRCKVPSPEPEFAGRGFDAQLMAYTVGRWEHDLVRLIQALEVPDEDYEHYIDRAGFIVVDEPG